MGDAHARVVVWATGWIGQIALRSIARRPDLELVGVWVHSPDKVGKDAGELAGIDPVGVAATNDADALLALRPDCVIYAAHRPERDAAAVPDYVRILEAGVNVVSVSTPGLVYPPNYEASFVAQLAAAAERGGASIYSSGIEPGFAADHLPLLLSTQSDRITSIHSTELFLYADYPVTFDMFDVMGFGMPMDYEPLLASPGGPTSAWGPSIHMIADALGRGDRGVPRGLRARAQRPAARGRVGHHRAWHVRGDDDPDHRRGARPRRDRDRAREPHGTRSRTPVADRATATASTGSRSRAIPTSRARWPSVTGRPPPPRG